MVHRFAVCCRDAAKTARREARDIAQSVAPQSVAQTTGLAGQPFRWSRQGWPSKSNSVRRRHTTLGPHLGRRAEYLVGSPDRESSEDVVPSSAQSGSNTEGDLLREHENPLLRSVLGDESGAEDLVRRVHCRHWNTVHDAFGPVPTSPWDGFPKRGVGTVPHKNHVGQEFPPFDVLGMKAVNLRSR